MPDVEKQAVHRQRAKLTKGAGVGLGALLSGVDQVVEDIGRRDLDGGERVARAVISSVTVGAASFGGASFGAFVGTAAGPVGTLGGGFYGGMVGGGVGEKIKGGMFKLFGVD